ncbi:BREX system P-loop protein BrxC [Agathobacter ruminis]|uniref:ATPase n=1 Tax=Agathobacter ruminis TaxID=1712665 RepID=A0A2G3E6N8_9FIRM|nr:BREX system P-loop protein BrxC [Agathobacter ruminis]MDC7301010.1 BREX system P-loop protein BrxC [Agathobacter ruminis]PHU38958.1 ATPase [Agathobacter ruminis]
MRIKDMFAKPIDREIQGVIIVGQGEETNVAQELEEYVVTRELQKHFADFFEAYKKGITGNTNEIGVWISGFFGSGKSHFLKILSYILANKEIDGKHAIDYFIDDNKISDAMVLSDMKLAAQTKNDVVLFNIDSKSDSNSKQNKDAIVNVFLKVFNEMQGFCGSLPHLADLESQLTDEGKYDAFKEAFEDEYGSEWESSRHKFDFIQDDVVEALVKIDFMSETAARNWCEKASETYRISIEDFAKRVKEYIDKKGDNRHVVFMVDEVGQYIGDDSNLMLNLQTVREELSKECKGKAWVVVTSQQDVDSIMKVKGNDFSKIQGRFATRLALSSANVDEVIKKRILDKNETGAQTLRLLYEQKATIIKNLIVFNDVVEKKLYADDNDFAGVYPFVPYQFNLLASVLTSIRTHGASGKHLSEGERSMLALFKESAVKIMEESEGAIVPFHRFYDALENFLDHSHRSVIIRAFDNSKINPDNKTDDVFAINVLKTLFMIKYILEIEANVENITSLMIDNIDNDRIELKERVEHALNVLIQQTVVQKNGSIYVFLTDEEQEIRREIDAQNVELAEVINKASEMIFEDIISDKKYRCPAFNGRYAFSYNQNVDDRPYKTNQNFAVGLRILTPWYDGGNNDTMLRGMSVQNAEVVVLLPNDSAFLEELMMYLKIEKFLRLNTSSQLTKYETIKEAKRVEMRERNSNARLYLTEALKDATIYVNGDIANLSSKEVTQRINEAIGRLVQIVYHKLPYIDAAYDETNIRKMFADSNLLKLDLVGGTESNQHALDDVLSFISGNTQIHIKTSMKTIKDRFMSAPYGFVEDDVHWLIARLFKRGDLSFTVNGSSISIMNKSADEIVDYIIKKQYLEKLLIEVKTRRPEKEKKAVQTTCKELFGVNITSDDEEYCMSTFQSYSQNRLSDMQTIEVNYKHYDYPGKKIIDKGKQLMQAITLSSTPDEFYEYVYKHQDDLLDFGEDYEPVKAFFNGEQMQIFTRALDMLEIYDDSKTYIVDSVLEDIVAQMRTIVQMDSPYREIPKLPDLRNKFMNAYTKVLEDAAVPVKQSIEDDRDRVVEVVDTKEYKDEKKPEYIKLFMEILEGADTCNNVSRLRAYADEAGALKIRLLDEMSALDAKLAAEKAAKIAQQQQSGGESYVTPVDAVIDMPVKKTKNVSIKNVAMTSSWRIEKAEDVDKYVDQLKKSLMDELNNNDIINVEF